MSSFLRFRLLLKRVLSAGALEAGTWSKVRSIQLANAIALITAFLFMVLVSYLISNSGWTVVVQVGLVTIAALLFIIVLNALHLYTLSRTVMCVIVPLAVLAAIFLPRMNVIGQYAYFRSPDVYIILVTSSVIPLLVYSLRERTALFYGLLVNGLILFSFDFILYRFSSSNIQPYTFLRFVGDNVVVLIMYLFLTGSIAFFKDLFEHFEVRNEDLIGRLNKKNTELHHSNHELYELNQSMEAQNEEILAQSEELAQSQESVMHANVEI